MNADYIEEDETKFLFSADRIANIKDVLDQVLESSLDLFFFNSLSYFQAGSDSGIYIGLREGEGFVCKRSLRSCFKEEAEKE